MSIKLEKGDLIVTNAWDGKVYEICTHVGVIGFLMYNMSCNYKPHLERYVKEHESLPYSSTIVRKSGPHYEEVMKEIRNSLLQRAREEKENAKS